MKKFLRNKYLLTTFFTIIIYIMYLKMMEIYPFGEYSILKSDLYQQYVNFLCYFREVLINGKSLIISWNLGLANYFYTTFSYYLVSPINLIVIFFNSNNMDLCVELIILIKLILMSNFFILFLNKSYNFQSFDSVIFGLIYAFSSYVVCYSFHIMWLDPIYMLPLILLTVDKYIENNKIGHFIICLAYAILTNYYIGYIVAFFSGIYFLAKIAINGKDIKYLYKFVIGIIVAFGIGMITILPSIMQLKGKMNANVSFIKFDWRNILLFINVIFNNYIYAFTQKVGFAFSSTLTLVLVPMYFLNNNIGKKEKIAFSCIIIFLLLPTISPFLNKLWHAFTTPNCFNFRYSFTLIFLLILIGAREWQNKQYSKNWHFIVSGIVFTLLTILEIMLYKKGMLKSDNFEVTLNSIIISCLIYGTVFLLTFFIFNEEKILRNKYKNIITAGLTIIITIDLLIGAKSGQNNNDIYFKREHFLQYNKIMEHLKNKIELPEIERIVFEPDEYGSNMSLRFGYSNIGYFTSARNRDVLKSMYRLGYNVQMDEQLWITSYSGTFLNYDLVGVKYYITKNKIEDNEIYGFELEEKYDDFYIYKNKNSFNIGYYLAQNIEQRNNPFDMQNDILNNLYVVRNLKENGKKYFQNIENSDVIECKKKIMVNRKEEFNEKAVATKEKSNIKNEDKDEKEVIYKIKAKKNCNIYLQSDYDLQLYIDNKPIFQNYSNIWSKETGIKQIKKLEENEELEFKIFTKEALENIYIYVSNNEEIQKIMDIEKKNTFENITINKNGLKGVANFRQNGYLVFSIAYDKIWDIFVDGQKVQKEAVAGCFLGTKIKKGKHNIEVRANIIKPLAQENARG